ncbi:MAG TPA: enoyl-CoA hydratase/isomerase family protein [Puia sp.]|nr:enoyl-CoA hydratase/isomerase family protein [Puia sp.]
MQELETGYVKSEQHGFVMTIEFYHPQSNSLPSTLLNELAIQIHGAGLDDEIKVVVLRSLGEKAFCAGASFAELSKINSSRQGEDFFNGFVHVINSMRKCPKFILARVQGKCVGGGVGIVAAADYAIALTGAEIKLSELEIGIGPFVVGPVVNRKLGLSAFSQLAIDSTSWRTADWAKTRGLYAEVHTSIQDMDESIQRLANHLSHSSSHAIREIKKMLWHDTSHWDQLLAERAKISGSLIITPMAQRAISLFNKA